MSPEMGAAVVAAFAELGHVKKDAAGHHGKYATIGAVLDTAKPILAKHGLAVMQYPATSEPGNVVIVTAIVHTSGEMFTDGGLRMPAPNDPQKVGGAISYARRYSLVAFLGLAPDDDDDGQTASDAIAKENEPHPNEDRVRDVLADIKRLTDTKKEELKAWADGRKLTGSSMIGDEKWLGHVEDWLSEYGGLS